MTTADLFDLGLQTDLLMARQSVVTRRAVLKLGLMGMGALLASCMPAATAPAATSEGGCVTPIPGETAGPYPADGSNASNQTLNALAQAGIVRQDIRTSLSTGNTAAGVPLTITLTLVNTNANCAPLAGQAVYLWHCDRAGNYSLYSAAAVAEDYLRGVQATDANGKVTFTTIFPGCYAGRWPHAHFEIYSSLAQATNASNVLHTSQLALPEDICQTVYASAGYDDSPRNLAQLSLATDNVFRDDSAALQMATLAGDMTNGYQASLMVGLAA